MPCLSQSAPLAKWCLLLAWSAGCTTEPGALHAPAMGTHVSDAGAGYVDARGAGDVQAGDATTVPDDASALPGTLACGLAEPSKGCPARRPTLGADCAQDQLGLACPYPPGGETWLDVMLCQEDIEGPSWSSITATCARDCDRALASQDMIALTGVDCRARPMRTCNTRGLTAQERLDRSLHDLLVDGCGISQSEWYLDIIFEAGCAVSFSQFPIVDPSAARCVSETLNTLRFDCAVDLHCARTEISTLASQ